MRFSVIMPVTLSDYPGAATERRKKFIRAVDSFRLQIFTSAELIIVSDGCSVSADVHRELYSGCRDIKMIEIPKQELFSGNVRNAGLEIASGEYICYLDSDDCIGSNHLFNIDSELTRKRNPAWAYYDETIGFGISNYGVKTVKPEYLKMGTSSIVHKNGLADWESCNGYGHDWIFAQKLLKVAKGVKIKGAEYYICHFSGMFADGSGNVKKVSIDV